MDNKSTTDQALEERKEMSRRGGRVDHPSLHNEIKTPAIIDPLETEKWVVLSDHADIGSDHMMEYTDANMPKDIIDSYHALGYKVGMFGIKNYMNNNIAKGWIAIPKKEIPRWGDFFLSTGEGYEGGLDDYCTFVDLICMKISYVKFGLIRATYDKSLKNDLQFSAMAERNGNFVDNNQPGGMTSLSSKVRS